MGVKTSLNKENKPLAEIGPVTKIKGIRKENIIYALIWLIFYTWFISFTTWWTASPLSENGFSMDIRSLIFIISLLSSSVFIFKIEKEQFFKGFPIGLILIIVGIGIILMGSNVQIQILSAIIIGIAIGIINASIIIPFVFILNNTEKLYAVVGINFMINLTSLFQEVTGGNLLQYKSDLILSFIILCLAIIAILFIKKRSLETALETSDIDIPTFHSRIYLTLLFNCIFVILCKGVGNGILNITAYTSVYLVLIWYYLGGIVGCIVYLAIYKLSKKPFIWLGNITFGFFAMGLLYNVFALQIPKFAIVFAILLGIGSTIGIINIFYIIGVIGKKYNSMQYLRLSILIIGVCGGITGIVIGNFVHHRNTFIISMIGSIVSITVMLLFIMLSALVSQSDYYDDWAKDSEKSDIDNEQLYLFNKYKLSKREIQVCKLLLQGYTMRQISGILSISYSTVNTYCTSTYRKLKINSRTELLLLFKDYCIK